MSFYADKQTLEDLNILGKYKPGSIFSLFNKVQTMGAGNMLSSMFQHPLTCPVAINERTAIFQYFGEQSLSLPFDQQLLSIMEGYLHNKNKGNLLLSGFAVARKYVLSESVRDEAYPDLLSGIKATQSVIESCMVLITRMTRPVAGDAYSEEFHRVENLLKDLSAAGLNTRNTRRLSLFRAIRLDYLLRHQLHASLSTLLQLIYHLDVCIAVSAVARSRGLCYPRALTKEKNFMRASQLKHLQVEHAIGNPVSFYSGNNVMFLTGANMAGKSTLMKAFGTSVYLAHMGFPIDAEEMVFSVKDGIYSSINVPDSLSQGLSHFYAEVLRVKTVAQGVSSGKDLYVIFDELFKGTNVKDAYDATLQVTEAFANYQNCFFIISTHIIEVGEALKQCSGTTRFVFLPTKMVGTIPSYTYQLQEGITEDRQGMIIIENEGILNMLNNELKPINND
ncbi:DNA mismatch repair protein [Pedobacter sp. KBW06]|uniref:MutS-related protein n=1 Tax=Pedobacter sp. KBW06 TaxID=2153359 RepID=UPI000F5A318B|nr:DNA mismatch repair protein [Pedobacter sp. KBW06]RQO74459.1 DNA mismatch repair protein [Pedobacter sp. KBW06]